MRSNASDSPPLAKGDSEKVKGEDDFNFTAFSPQLEDLPFKADGADYDVRTRRNSKSPDVPRELLDEMHDLRSIGICEAAFVVKTENPLTSDEVIDGLTAWCEENIEGNFLDEIRSVVSESETGSIFISAFFAPEPKDRKDFYIEQFTTVTFGDEEKPFELEYMKPVLGGQLAIFCLSIPFINGFYMEEVKESVFTNYGQVLMSLQTDPIKFAKRIHGQKVDSKTYDHVLVNLNQTYQPDVAYSKKAVQYPPRSMNFQPLSAPPFLVEIRLITRVNLTRPN